MDALLGDSPSRALRERLAALEAERDEVEAAIADVVRLGRHENNCVERREVHRCRRSIDVAAPHSERLSAPLPEPDSN